MLYVLVVELLGDVVMLVVVGEIDVLVEFGVVECVVVEEVGVMMVLLCLLLVNDDLLQFMFVVMVYEVVGYVFDMVMLEVVLLSVVLQLDVQVVDGLMLEDVQYIVEWLCNCLMNYLIGVGCEVIEVCCCDVLYEYLVWLVGQVMCEVVFVLEIEVMDWVCDVVDEEIVCCCVGYFG